MNVSVTLVFPSAEAAAAALTRLSRIDPLDIPDVGADLQQSLPFVAPPVTVPFVAPAVDPVALFGTATAVGAAVVPVPPPVPTPALSSAAAAAPPTAPAAPSGTPAALPVPPAPALPSAPAAAAPTAPVVQATSASGVERDSTGLPWDTRIHSSPGKKGDPKPVNKDGTWRQRRGLNDPALVKRIEAELRATVAGAAAATPAATLASLPAPPTGAALPVPPAPPAAPVPPAPPVAAAPADFGALMALLAPKLAADFPGTNAKLMAILTPLGVASLGALSAVPALIPSVKQQIEAW